MSAREKAGVVEPTAEGAGDGDAEVAMAHNEVPAEQLDALAGGSESRDREGADTAETGRGGDDPDEADAPVEEPAQPADAAPGGRERVRDAEPRGAGEEVEVGLAAEDPRFVRARELESEGDLGAAIALYRELLFDDPRNLKARNNLGVIYDRRGDHTLALEQFEAARDIDADNVDVLLNVAAALAALRRYDPAEKELRRAHRLEPGRADVHASMGILSFRRGLYGQAELELKRALDLDPGHATAYFYRGECLNQLGRVDEALRMLERSVQLHPHNPRAYFTMGILFDRKHLPQQAAAMYRKAREITAA